MKNPHGRKRERDRERDRERVGERENGRERERDKVRESKREGVSWIEWNRTTERHFSNFELFKATKMARWRHKQHFKTSQNKSQNIPE